MLVRHAQYFDIGEKFWLGLVPGAQGASSLGPTFLLLYLFIYWVVFGAEYQAVVCIFHFCWLGWFDVLLSYFLFLILFAGLLLS